MKALSLALAKEISGKPDFVTAWQILNYDAVFSEGQDYSTKF